MTPVIAIIGAGPAGCALACFLQQRGTDCLVFDDDKRPGLLVGESLVSAAIPILRRLGVEEAVAEISMRKPGASLRHENGNRVDFQFNDFGQAAPGYAYNIPRPQFDKILRQRAEQLGVRFVSHRAKVLATPDNPDRDISLDKESLAAAGLDINSHPKLLIDATGRHRLFSRVLDLPTARGQRDDVAYFSHFKNFAGDATAAGQVVISVLNQGWSWQIPLQDRLSVGVVINKESVNQFGNTPEQRLNNLIDTNPLLAGSGRNRRRVSPIMSYANYQLITQRGYGNGWVLLGDAFGFVDPMLSPGVFMALQSAVLLDYCLAQKGGDRELQEYSDTLYSWHQSWDRLIQYFYDGRLLSLHQEGSNVIQNSHRLSPARLLEQHISRVLSSMVTGVKTCSRYNHALLHYSCQHLLTDDYKTLEHAIKSNSARAAAAA